MTTDETPFVLWKVTFALPLDEAANPLYEVCRMPNLVRDEQFSSIYALLIDLDRRNDAITFSPYIKVTPDQIHLAHAQLQGIQGYVGSVQIQEEPGDPFEEPENPTIVSFYDFEPSWLRPFNVIGKVSDVKGLHKDVTGWFWTFNLLDSRGYSIRCWFYTRNDEEMEEGTELPNVNEGDLALCVNATPNLEEGIRIGKRSELLIFRE